jgi:hypothetical protein
MSASEDLSEEVVSSAFELCDDYQQGTGPNTANYWCISTRTSVFTWAILCCFIEGCVLRLHLGSM